MSTKNIARHEFPLEGMEEAVESLGRTMDWILGELEDPNDTGRSNALAAALATAKAHSALDPTATKFPTWEAWITAMQIGSALFDSATAAEGPVPCRVGIEGEVRNLPATGPRYYLHPGAWVTAFYLAVICRENDRLERLAHVPVEFLRASGAVVDEYIYDWVETLQNLWFGREETWDTLLTAVNGTAPEVTRVAEVELMLKQLYPPLELLHRYLSRETDRFNAALDDALTWHHEYWTAEEDRSCSTEGLVALGPLAIACMARDADMPIKVESDYLPKVLLEFGWIGEVDA